MLRYWTGWQQVHERLAKQTEVSPTVLSADGSGAPYRRRAANFRCGRYLVDASSGFSSGCGQPLGAFREQPPEQKRRARVGHHHDGQTFMGYVTVYRLPNRLPAKSALTWPVVYLVAYKPSHNP